MSLASQTDMEFASLRLQLDEAWAARDQYLEQNVKLKAEVERLTAARNAAMRVHVEDGAEIARLTEGRDTMGNLWAREKEARAKAEAEIRRWYEAAKLYLKERSTSDLHRMVVESETKPEHWTTELARAAGHD